MNLNKANENHLRRLLGWLECELGVNSDQIIAIAQNMADKTSGDIELQSLIKPELERAFNKSQNTPKYIRQAIKQLKAELNKNHQTVTGDFEEIKLKHLENKQ